MTEIKHHNSEKNGKFEILHEGQPAGELIYTWKDGNTFSIDHTEVNSAFNGLGLGKKLIEAAVKFAQENQKKIIPLCPFAKTAIAKNLDWQEVV